ncbi:FH1/FH2 domain-containing protein 3-like isoform X2 [Hemiscyllium ocellatum]|uniref:FH1/FH2 domain-containing protein 3-like isoform X2 n=1 Tax=Hemiscyllium ocellatum TaxID=170820 RepID=UPI002966556D|nr:FH1/FH2 domain-containing protein 3-like isoform X2 [Hemiscyllium ocellatum]
MWETPLTDGVKRRLRLQSLDFTDLWEDGEGDALPPEGPDPDPDPVPRLLPPPPPPPPAPARPQAPPGTVRLFWRALPGEPPPPLLPRCSRFGPRTLWASLEPVAVDGDALGRLFAATHHQQRLCSGRTQELTVLGLKRSNAINIGLTALPAPHVIRAALLSFDQCVLDKDAIERLLTMVPTDEELVKIREAKQANTGLRLGSAEQFLLTLASVSELQARLHLWAFTSEYEAREKDIAVPLFNLKMAMEQLASNKTFHCILATLLAIGNFLNGANAKGFELSYLEKVPGVRDTVSKQPLLHHACSIIVQNFPDTTDLYSEITAVTQSAKVDFSQLQADLTHLEVSCKAAWDHAKVIAKRDSGPVFKSKTPAFLKECAQRIIILKAVHRRVRNRFHSFLLYFGYPSSSLRNMAAGKFFQLISDFALEYHTTRAQILQQRERQERLQREAVPRRSRGDRGDRRQKESRLSE